LAAVVVSVVHVVKGEVAAQCRLDHRMVTKITAFLFDDGGHDDPLPIGMNQGRSFIGTYVLGMGFTFDDTNDEATSLAEMARLTAKNPKNSERIVPYLGGEEVNESPTHLHHRFIINFGDMDETEVRAGWPELMRIVEEKVRPERIKQNDRGAKVKWWQFIRPRPELAAAIQGMDRVLVRSLTSKNFAFTFVPASLVHDQTLIVFALSKHSQFAALSCRVHETWSAFQGATLEDRPRYNIASCFETFPFPKNFETDPRLEAAGKAYYEFRADLMVRINEGLTKTYNRFHDPDEQSPDIKKLRELHAAMDRAVLDAYGWTDLQPTHEFLLDYEEEDDEEGTGRGKKRKKPWRYRWPDDFRDEVLARLLKLNQERAEQERLQPPPAKEPTPDSPSGKKRGRPRKGDTTPSLFGKDDDA